MAGGSRFQQKQQKRRQNGVLNIAIAIVLVAVAIVAYQLFVPDTKEQASSSDKRCLSKQRKRISLRKLKAKKRRRRMNKRKQRLRRKKKKKS